MATMTDIIEKFIKDLMEEDNSIQIQRNELANLFSCAPSQINYVLTTRFTIDRGYYIESKKGGGGYVQIEKSTKENYQGIISNIEFRGNLLRVEIKDKLNENFIISDVSIKEWVNLNLVEGDLVKISIDEKYYLKYPKVKGA